MNNKKTGILAASFLLITAFIFQTYPIPPNPIISRNKLVYGSPSYNVGILVNGKFGETWSVNDGSWVAIKLDGNYSQVLLNWNNPGYSWSDVIASATSCKSGLNIPVDYDILTSPNSTDGANGDWTTVLTVRNNTVTARSHSIDFSGSQWIKMSIIKGAGFLDELEVFDISNGSKDTWFFPGTSISANAYKSNPPEKNFADLISESHPTFNPAIIRGGIPCINSTTMAQDISKYLDVARTTRFWAIEMGTNDAWGGSSYNVSLYKANMQLIIDSCRANNIEPVIARIIGTDSSKAHWQVHPDFLKAIDSLTLKNNLIPGPDLYTYFSTHPEELSDGVHPNATGGASLFRLWAEKMDSLYESGASISRNQFRSKRGHDPFILASRNGSCTVNVKNEGTLSIYSLKGALLEKVDLPANGSYTLNRVNGFCIVRFSSSTGNYPRLLSGF